MRSAIALLLLLMAPALCCAQTVIPFQLRHGLVYVSATINGKPVHAVLDSGTGGIAVDERHAKAMGLKIGRPIGQALGGGTGNQSMSTLQLRSVRLGPITLHDARGLAMNLSPLFADAGVPFTALLGYPVFARHVVTIDYAKRELVVYPPAGGPTCQSPIAITGFVGGVPIVAARLRFPDSRKVYTAHLLVDTGTLRVAVALGKRFVHVKAVQSITSRTPVAHGNGTGGKVFGWNGTLAELEIGSQHFRGVPMGLSSDVSAFNIKEAQGSIGVTLWKAGSITFNYPRKQLCIDVSTDTEARPASAAKPGTSAG